MLQGLGNPAHYKRGCLAPPLSLKLLNLLFSSLALLLPILSSLSPHGHGWLLLPYSSSSFWLSTINTLKPGTISPLIKTSCSSMIGIGLTLKSHVSPPAAKPLSVSSHQTRLKTLTSWETLECLIPLLPSPFSPWDDPVTPRALTLFSALSQHRVTSGMSMTEDLLSVASVRPRDHKLLPLYP